MAALIRARRAWLMVASMLLLSGPAAAEIYKCAGPDGRTLFTSDQSRCPDAPEHRLGGQLQTVPSGSDREAPPAQLRRPLSGVSDDVRASQWKQKKAQARSRLEDVSARAEYLRRAAALCNRGGSLYVESDTGIRRNLSCEAVQREFEEIERVEAELRAYLAGGIEEECRRAGCLPGWIRD